MRRSICIIISVLLLLLPSCSDSRGVDSKDKVTTEETGKRDKYVYITPSGGRYHHSWCRTIQGHSVKKMTVRKARMRGRTRCQICFNN